MKKRNKTVVPEQITQHNPVAKFAHSFNKSLVFADKTQYRRNAKHKKQEVSLSIFSNSMFSQAA